MSIMKNINKAKVMVLKDQVSYQEGQIVSKTLVQNESVSITLFAFDKGEEISTHESGGDAFVTCLDGMGRITIDGKEYLLREGEGDFMERLNRDSVQTLHGYIEPEILKAKPEDKFQLMRMGYFCADRRDFSPEHVVLNQIVGLKDTFAKVVKR